MGGIQAVGVGSASCEEMLPELRGLTEQARTMVLEYLFTGDQEAAEAAAGYANRAVAAAAWRGSRVQAAIKALTRSHIRGPSVIKAIRTMDELMEEKPGRSDAVRLTAAKWVLESAGHGAKADSDGLSDKPLAEMTEDELGRFIASQAAVIERNGHAGVIDVTPNK